MAHFKKFKKSIRKFFAVGHLSLLLISYFGLTWIIHLTFNLFGINDIYLTFFLSLLAFNVIRSRLAKKSTIVIFIGLGILRLFADRSIYNLPFLYSFVFTFVLWYVLYGLFGIYLNSYSDRFYQTYTKKSRLAPGMIIHTKGHIGPLQILDENEVHRLKNDTLRKGYAIKRTMPFAPIIFCGVIATILANGNVLILVWKIILSLVN